MPDLNQMAVFAAVARAQSFTAAARALRMPKSTVSQRVAELERRLGVELLARTTRAVRLTDAGAAYYDRCARLVSEAEEADRLVRDRERSARGTLRVTTTMVFGHTFLAPLVAEYLAAQPHVAVEVVLTDRRLDLVDEQIDLAVRAGAVEASLVARRLGVGASVLVASPAYVAAAGQPRRPADLARHGAVAVGADDDAARWTLVRGARSEAVAVPARVRANTVFFARAAALAGAGVALLPTFLCDDAVAAGRLVRLLPGWTSRPVPIFVAYPPNRYPAVRVRAFVDLLLARFGTAPPWQAEHDRADTT